MTINQTFFEKAQKQSKSLVLTLILILLFSDGLIAQKKTSFSISVDPSINWFASDRKSIDTKGSRAGISYGLIADFFFSEKYAFSTGIGIQSAGGTVSYQDTVGMQTSYDTIIIPSGTVVKYSINYLSIPLGLKLKTVAIGYKTFYVDLGVKVLFRLKAKASTENNLLQKDKVNDETNLFNMSYNIGAGMEYSLGGTTSIMVGFYYSRTFLDVTTDILGKPSDNLSANILSLRMGIIF